MISNLKTSQSPARSNLPRIGNHHRSRPALSGPRGFTLLELLVVIGIILILIGMFFAGAKIVTAQAKARDTKTALETCKTMFANYQQATHLSRYPYGVSFDPIMRRLGQGWTKGTELAIGSVTPGALGLVPAPRLLTATDPQILLDTAYVMSALASIPENQTIIANLPANKKLNVLVPTAYGTSQATLILDGFGNPIFFVPGGGLGLASLGPGDLWLDGANYGVVTSAGVYSAATNPPLSSYVPANALSNQPFFVSAGPDDDLSNAHGYVSGPATSDMTDDNLYSFQN